jgi:hypothetical protein
VGPSPRFSVNGIGGLEVLSEDGGIAFCRGRRQGTFGEPDAVLFMLPASEQPTPATVVRLAHEYSFKHELDGAWGRCGRLSLCAIVDGPFWCSTILAGSC